MNKLLFGLLFSAPFACSAVDRASDNMSVSFVGEITQASVQAFISKYENHRNIAELRISSQGGDVRAAIELGNWVHKKNIDVRVRTICYSGCANYVFPAGKNKVIEPGSFVAWHGDMEQRDFRELIEKYNKILRKDKTNRTEDEVLFLEKNMKKYTTIKELRQLQSDLYTLLKLEPEFGRIGQEPIEYPSDGWTLTKKAMEHYGIVNVEVPPEYATQKYFSSDPTSTLVNGGPLLILDLDSSGKIVPINLDKVTAARQI